MARELERPQESNSDTAPLWADMREFSGINRARRSCGHDSILESELFSFISSCQSHHVVTIDFVRCSFH